MYSDKRSMDAERAHCRKDATLSEKEYIYTHLLNYKTERVHIWII